MSKLSVTYKAPKGDSKVCEMYGHTFYDGKATEIEDTPENAETIKSLWNHSLFEVKGKSEYASGPQPTPKPEPAPGTPPPQPQPEDGEEEDGGADEKAEDDEPPFEDYKPGSKKAARVK